MPTLQEKVLRLRQDAALAVKLADFYDRAIAAHGAEKVESFYTKQLGLNHIERKVEWEGLQLRRQPRDSEKLCVKGIATAQASAQSSLSSLLLTFRTSLITDGLAGISALSPADYHSLVLQVDASGRQSLKDRLLGVWREGRALVARELSAKAASDDADDFGELDTLTDVTNSRLANDVQARITAAAARATQAGLEGADWDAAVRAEIEDGSTAYVERTATGLANKTISIGRSDEAAQHDVEKIEYSALLDANVCGPCSVEDGRTASDESALTPAPNPDCEGFDNCRCFHVYITA